MISKFAFSFLAPVAWSFALIKNIIVDTAFTANGIAKDTIYLLILLTEFSIPEVPSNYIEISRPWWKKTILGAPGFFVGPALGVAVTVILRSILILSDNLKSFSATKKYITELVISEGQSLKTPLFSDINSPHWFKRYLMGGAGFVIGSVFGLGEASVIIIGKVLNDTRISFSTL